MSEAVDVGAHLALQVQKDSMDAVRDESPRSVRLLYSVSCSL